MSRRWSKLQKELYVLRADNLDMQLHCRLYRMKSQWGSTNSPRYWITIGKEIIWDYPKQFRCADNPARENPEHYPYVTDIPDISHLIRTYIDTPKSELLKKVFSDDHWHLTNILKACDKRIGQRRLHELAQQVQCDKVTHIVSLRKHQSAASKAVE